MDPEIKTWLYAMPIAALNWNFSAGSIIGCPPLIISALNAIETIGNTYLVITYGCKTPEISPKRELGHPLI